MVSESTNKLGAQEALRPYLGAKEAKAHRVLSQISLPTESILYKEGGRGAVVLLGSTAPGRQREQAQLNIGLK